MVKMFKSKNLQSVKHSFFGRSGGVSTGIYSSLNLSENTTDNKANIYANRALVLDALDISSQKGGLIGPPLTENFCQENPISVKRLKNLSRGIAVDRKISVNT